MSQTAGLIFTNDSGAGSGTSSYVTDTLPDYTFPANSNAGFSSSILNNPLSNSYGNTDLPQFGAKTLQIKDLLFVNDRSQWIQGKTTYQVIFYENFPQIKCYVFGNVELVRNGGQASVLVKTIGDGISVNGVIRQVAFILQPNSAASATAQVVVDNSNESTVIDFSSATSSNISNPPSGIFNAYVHNTTLENYNIHDIRLTANQASTLSVNGIIVYFQGPNSNIDQLPGTSYINKTKSTTTAGVSLAIPAVGSSLGGNFLVYKTQFAGYTLSALSATTIATTASGSSGTNLLALGVGTGASFASGYGIIATQGASTYIGSIVSMSTDTATMGTTLGFGLTAGAQVYTAWRGGNTLSINASLMTLGMSIDFSRMNPVNGFSQTIFDTQGRFALWGNNIGMTQIDGNQCALFLGASGFMQVDGYFSACEMETLGNGIFSATLSINGLPSWSQNAGQTGTVKKTIFTDAGPGWNSFNIGVGASMGIIGLQRINLYQRQRDLSVSYGILADFDISQTYTNRDAINASLMALGGVKRTYADQLYFKNTWNRGQTWSVPGGVFYQGASTNGSLTFQYYGTHFGIIGSLNTGSTLTLDGVGVGLTANIMQTVATLGFHTINYTGGTAQISAIDYLNPSPNKSRVNVSSAPILSPTPALVPPSVQVFLGGSGLYCTPQTPRPPLYLEVTVVGGGGGGGGSGAGGQAGSAGGTTSFGPVTCTGGSGGSGGAGAAAPASGGTVTIGSGAFGLSVSGGSGGGIPINATGNPSGGDGGNSILGGGGGGGSGANGGIGVGAAGSANTGGGGGAGGAVGTSSSGGGGGAGGGTVVIIPNPAEAYNFGVGAGGASNSGGASSAGGAGAAGVIIVREFYQ